LLHHSTDEPSAALLLGRQRGSSGASLVHYERTVTDCSSLTEEPRLLSSLSEDEKLTAIFVSTLGGTVPGDDDTELSYSAADDDNPGRICIP
jgi:hypothetical protein